MFFAGVYINEKSGSGDVVIIEKVLKSAKKQYFIRGIKVLPPGTSCEDLVKELSKISEDERYIKKKKVFSQDGRPAKRKFEKPVIVLHVPAGETSLLEKIREARIPVDAVMTGDRKQGEESLGYYGADYHITGGDISKSLATACKNRRIVYENGTEHLADLVDTCTRQMKNGSDPFSDAREGEIAALSLAVWHCETIRKIKRY